MNQLRNFDNEGFGHVGIFRIFFMNGKKLRIFYIGPKVCVLTVIKDSEPSLLNWNTGTVVVPRRGRVVLSLRSYRYLRNYCPLFRFQLQVSVWIIVTSYRQNSSNLLHFCLLQRKKRSTWWRSRNPADQQCCRPTPAPQTNSTSSWQWTPRSKTKLQPRGPEAGLHRTQLASERPNRSRSRRSERATTGHTKGGTR